MSKKKEMVGNLPNETKVGTVAKDIVEPSAMNDLKPQVISETRNPKSQPRLVIDKLPHRDVILGPLNKRYVARQTRIIQGTKWYLCSKDAEAETAMVLDRVTEKLQELSKLADTEGHLEARDKLTLLNTLRNLEYVIQPAVKLWDRTKRQFYTPTCADCDKPAVVVLSMAEWKVDGTETPRLRDSIDLVDTDSHTGDMTVAGVHPAPGIGVVIDGKRIA